MTRIHVLSFALLLMALTGVIGAQTIVCDGRTCGGTGVVSCDAQLRDYVYRVTGGTVPPALDSVFVGTHDPDLTHYGSVCLPTGWTYEIIPISRPDYSNPINHSVVSPAPDGNCPYTFLFRNVSGAPLSSSTPTDFGFDYYGYPHNVDWTVAAFPPVSADWASGVGIGAGPVHGPRCDTLCEHGVPVPNYYLAGNKDNFATDDGPEPSSPSPALLAVMAAISGGADPYFDSSIRDRCFGHTFEGWSTDGCIVGAQLCFRITAIAEGNNDFFNIRDDATTAVWGPAIKYLKAWHTGNPADTFWTVGDTLEVCLDLANMPEMKRGTTYYWPPDILATLDDGQMDFIMSDDTKIDYLELTVQVCVDTCYATGDVNGDGLSLTIADLNELTAFVYNGVLPAGSLWQGDLNGDYYIDQLDIDMYNCYFAQGMSCFPVWPVPTDCNPDTVRGSCCQGDSCTVKSPDNCDLVSGLYAGDSSRCEAEVCGFLYKGYCCLPDNTCKYMFYSECWNLNGVILESAKSCSPNPCRCMTLPRYAVAWWPRDEDPNIHKLARDLAKNHHGVIVTPPTLAPITGGVVRGAAQYDWANEGINRTAKDPFVDVGSNNFTIDAWIKPEIPLDECAADAPACQERYIVSNIYGLILPYWLAHGITFKLVTGAYFPADQVKLVLGILQNGVYQQFESDLFTVTGNDWYHVAVTVSRKAAPQEVIFYLDGQSLNKVTTPAPFTGLLYSGYKPTMDIGHGLPFHQGNSLSVNRYFSGWLDEVQIFRKVLTITDIYNLYTWGARGKCKDKCYVAKGPMMNPDGSYPLQKIVIINYDVYDRTYVDLKIKGSGITCFPPLPSSVTAAKNGGKAEIFTTVLPTQSKPLNPGMSRKFWLEATEQGSDPLNVLRCVGRIYNTWKITGDGGGLPTFAKSTDVVYPYDVVDLYPGESIDAIFWIYNLADDDGVIGYEIAEQSSCDCEDADTLISLDGNPPGVPVTGSLNIPIGDSAEIMVNVKLAEYAPQAIQSVAVIADWNGTGEPFAGVSIGVHALSLQDCNLNGIFDSLDIESGFSTDTNANTIPDECEYYWSSVVCPVPGDANFDGSANVGDAVYLIAYIFKGGAEPFCKPEADANGDCSVNVGDAVYLISYVFKGGAAPNCNGECPW